MSLLVMHRFWMGDCLEAGRFWAGVGYKALLLRRIFISADAARNTLCLEMCQSKMKRKIRRDHCSHMTFFSPNPLYVISSQFSHLPFTHTEAMMMTMGL